MALGSALNPVQSPDLLPFGAGQTDPSAPPVTPDQSEQMKQRDHVDATLTSALTQSPHEFPNPADYTKYLGEVLRAKKINEGEKAHEARLNPWGSPTNHPGFLGKLGHALGTIGNVAGDLTIGPQAMSEIPGSRANLISKEQAGAGAAKEQADINTAEQKAEAQQTTAGAHQTEAATHQQTEPIKASAAATTAGAHQQEADVKQNDLKSQFADIVLGGGKPGDPDYDRTLTALQSENKTNPQLAKMQHVSGTDGKGTSAFANYHADTGTYTHPDGSPFPDFKPAPTYAQTGFYQPTMVATPEGGMQPGLLNARSGAVTIPKTDSNVAIPRDVQTEVNKELETARNSDRRLAIMEHNLDSALRGDQQAMVSLVANHIGMTLGAQKGARINQAVWDEAIKSRPWLQGAQAKFDDRGYLSGVTLSPEQMHQMVDLAKEIRDQQWNQVNQAFGNYGIKHSEPASTAPENKPIEVVRDANGRITGIK